MKNWILLLIILVALVIAAVTGKYWIPPFLSFTGTQANTIQGLTGLVQLVLWVCVGISFTIGLILRIKRSKKPLTEEKRENEIDVGERGVSIAGDATDNIIITGDKSQVVVDKKRTAEHKALRTAYLNHIFNTTRHLSLAGVDPKTASEAEARLDLNEVYTALLTLTPETHEQWQRGKILEKESRHLSALDLLNRHPHLVLLGDPGTGKSTFVNFVALCMAGEVLGRKKVNLSLLTAPIPEEDKDKEKRQTWDHNAQLPVRVILRDFAARGLPPAGEKATARHLWDFITGDLESATLGDYTELMHTELLEQGGMLLVDGLDEVPEADKRRTQIKQAVEDFAAAFPDCRILVTSRTYAYQKQDWRLPDFAEAVLAPFTSSQINRFVDRWYAHIGTLRGLHEDDAQGRAELLKRAISANDRLRALAERPLLLTLMASLHAWRGGSLPEQREELYADTVDLLLDWWESPKIVRNANGQVKVLQPSLAEWLEIDRKKVRNLLNELAFKAHESQLELMGTADIAEGDLVSGFMNISQSQNPDVKPARLIEYISQRAGLLLPRGVGIYTFPHRTFQEYLAACYLTDHDYPDRLAELLRVAPNRWREVALLAGAKAARGTASSIWLLVEALCFREPQKATSDADAWGAHLAGQALVETVDLAKVSERNQPKVQRVQRWLVHILTRSNFPPVERARAGTTLAHLGDPRKEVMTLENMQFCYIPAGPFRMGSDEYEREKPPHLNEFLNYDYWISRYPITNAQFVAFVQDGGYREPKFWPEAKAAGVWNHGKVKGPLDDEAREIPYNFGLPYNLPNHPIVGVTWYEALAFTRWLNEHRQQQNILRIKTNIRLPSEAEWEKAARGGVEITSIPLIFEIGIIDKSLSSPLKENPTPKRRYPWGNNPDTNYTNFSETGIGSTNVVGCFSGGASPYGCEEMSGNLWEWTRSLWGKEWGKPEFKYPYELDDDRENLNAPNEVLRVVRGGSFDYVDRYLRCSYRYWDNPDDRVDDVGFRVVLFPCY